MTAEPADPDAIGPSAGAGPRTDGPLSIIVNQGSGSDVARDRMDHIRARLGAARRAFELLAVAPGSAMAGAVREGVERARAGGGVVVAAGGDGTVNAVAQQALGAGCAFGVLPAGTFNYFARVHGIPVDIDEALDVLLGGHAEPVQAARVNERVFLVNASLGLYPQLLEDREAYKARFGRSRLVALLAGGLTLLRTHRQLRLRVAWCAQGSDAVGPEIELRTPTLFVGNNRLQLEQIGIAQADALDRGQLVAVALRPMGTFAMLGLLLHGAMGQLGEADQVLGGAFQRMSVRPGRGIGRRRIKVATDGEIAFLRAPLRFDVAPCPLWLLKPPAPRPADAGAGPE